MEMISSGLTWNKVEELFKNDKTYSLSLEQRPRRASLKNRKKGTPEERKVWRLIVQQDQGHSIKTALRMNIKTDDAELKSKALSDKMVSKLNAIIA